MKNGCCDKVEKKWIHDNVFYFWKLCLRVCERQRDFVAAAYHAIDGLIELRWHIHSAIVRREEIIEIIPVLRLEALA